MKTSQTSVAWIVWWVFTIVALAMAAVKAYVLLPIVGLLLVPLTLFLLVRGLLRWMGKQWHHDSARGQ
jgi:hypothetical protein